MIVVSHIHIRVSQLYLELAGDRNASDRVVYTL